MTQPAEPGACKLLVHSCSSYYRHTLVVQLLRRMERRDSLKGKRSEVAPTRLRDNFIGQVVISLFTHQAETIWFVSSGHMNAIVQHNSSQPPLFIPLLPSSIQISTPYHQD